MFFLGEIAGGKGCNVIFIMRIGRIIKQKQKEKEKESERETERERIAQRARSVLHSLTFTIQFFTIHSY
jgi:hypothetical protein